MTAPGLEGILKQELRGLGIVGTTQIAGGVEFSGAIEHVQRINLWSRVASRVLVRIDEFHASSFHELERRAKKVDWARFVSPGQPARFRVTCRKSRLYHSDAVAERLGVALQRVAPGTLLTGTVSVDEEESEMAGSQLFLARIADDICTISADSSGELLHRRGYRKAVAKAPLRETLAAAMLMGCEWDPAAPLVDPMCGSGTIAIEAAMMARKSAPGLERSFRFEKWPDHDANLWRSTIDRAREQILPDTKAAIVASDRDAGAVKAAIENAARAGVAADIDISEHAVSDADYPPAEGWIVTNPPYGMRVGESAPLRNLYAQLGHVVRERVRGYRVALLSADKSLESQLRLDLREIFRTTNGGIPVRLVSSD